MPATAETRKYQAEVQELLDLMIHSLYSHKEIFLRELISNASDALDRLRLEALQDKGLLREDEPLFVRLEIDADLRLLRVIDNGIGMTREDVVENLGTIAHSGTRAVLEQLHAAGEGADPGLIGQFGVGFYSSFMVADEITVETLRAGSSTGVGWRSRGDGEYTLEEVEEDERGTSVTLHLRESEEGGEGDDEVSGFLDPRALAQLVRKYSDFVEYPICMDAALFEDAEGLERLELEDGREMVVLNSRKPLWARPKDEIETEEYAHFYQHLCHDWNDPLEVVHFKAEGTHEYTALLYVPGRRPFDLSDPAREKSRIHLYVRRIFVMADCEDLMPPWLRFVRGVVDAQDLPLNVSREILQQNRTVTSIRQRLVGKVLNALGRLLRERREDYATFWESFGSILKEGLFLEPERRDELARLALFATTHGEEATTLGEYVERMAEGQEEIYYLLASERGTAESSPHLEALRERELEALLLLEPVDEWVVQRLEEFDGRKLRSLNQGDVDLIGPERREQREQREREDRPLLEALETGLGDRVGSVRLSSRLTDSVAVLVDPDGAPTPHMQRLMRQNDRELPQPKRILELNPDHALTERLRTLHGRPGGEERLREVAELILDQALLIEGSPLPDPRRFADLVTDLLVDAAGGDPPPAD